MYSPGKIDLIQERLIGAEARGAAPSLRQSKILPPQALGGSASKIWKLIATPVR